MLGEVGASTAISVVVADKGAFPCHDTVVCSINICWVGFDVQ